MTLETSTSTETINTTGGTFNTQYFSSSGPPPKEPDFKKQLREIVNTTPRERLTKANAPAETAEENLLKLGKIYLGLMRPNESVGVFAARMLKGIAMPDKVKEIRRAIQMAKGEIKG